MAMSRFLALAVVRARPISRQQNNNLDNSVHKYYLMTSLLVSVLAIFASK